jgi:hypothetical protein
MGGPITNSELGKMQHREYEYINLSRRVLDHPFRGKVSKQGKLT